MGSVGYTPSPGAVFLCLLSRATSSWKVNSLFVCFGCFCFSAAKLDYLSGNYCFMGCDDVLG